MQHGKSQNVYNTAMSVRFSDEPVLRDEPLIRRPQSCGLLVSKL